MDKRFRNAKVKVREEFEDDCEQDRSNAELMFDGAKMLLDSITAQEVKFEKK